MKAALSNKTLQDYVEAVTAVADEAIIQPHEGGWRTVAVDAAHICMVDVTLDADKFDALKMDEPLGVDFKKLAASLKLAKSGERAELHTSGGSLTLITGSLTHRMGTLPADGMTKPKIPDLNFNARAEVELSDVKTSIKAADTLSDHVKISGTTGGLTLGAQGTTDTVTYKVPAKTARSFQIDEDAVGLYGTGYFFQLLGAVKAGSLTLEWSTDYPVAVSWVSNGVNARYLLAPRIENE